MSVVPDAPATLDSSRDHAGDGRRGRWTLPVVLGVSGGLLVAAGILTFGPDRARTAPVDTRVAGISVERSSNSGDPSSGSPTTSAGPERAGPGASTAAPSATAPSSAAPETTAPDTAGAVDAASAAAPTAASAPTAAAVPVAASGDTLTDLRTRVLAQLSFPWESVLAGWEIDFLPERSGFRGSTFPRDRRIEVYLREGSTLADYVHVTAHEMGHAVDVTLLDDDDHERWNVVRGREPGAAWWVASGADDFSSGAGDWAECFAWSQLPSGRFYSRVGPAPSAEQLAAMADIIASASR